MILIFLFSKYAYLSGTYEVYLSPTPILFACFLNFSMFFYFKLMLSNISYLIKKGYLKAILTDTVFTYIICDESLYIFFYYIFISIIQIFYIL